MEDLEIKVNEQLDITMDTLKNAVRNQFAASALTGLLTHTVSYRPEFAASEAFKYADAMLVASVKK